MDFNAYMLAIFGWLFLAPILLAAFAVILGETVFRIVKKIRGNNGL